MIERVSSALQLSLRERNMLLKSAGFAPLYLEHAPDEAALAPLHAVIARALAAHEPFPAFAADRAWRPLAATRGALSLWRLLRCGDEPPDPKVSVVRAACASPSYRQSIANWPEVASHLEQLVLSELHHGAAPDMRAELSATLKELEGARRGEEVGRPQAAEAPFLIMRIVHPQLTGSFVTTIARFGAPHDAGAEDMRIEFYYCLDAASETAWREYVSATPAL